MLMYGFQCRVLQRLAVSTSKNMMACSRILLLNSFFYFVKFWKSRIILLKVLMVIMMCEPLCGKLVSCQVFLPRFVEFNHRQSNVLTGNSGKALTASVIRSGILSL